MEPILTVEHLKTHFFKKEGVIKAVDDISFHINPGEIVGLVGESGSGKTITGFSILGLIDPPGKIVSGKIKFKDMDLQKISPKQMQDIRGNRIAMIFQDPMMTLNPVLRIQTQMMETIKAHNKTISNQDAYDTCRDALGLVGISSPDERMKAYPHQFSGGMRQRVSIAIALLNKPDLIIADEPTTALDVTIQGQVIFEMQKLCKDSGTALLWVTHDLAVVAGITDRISVMYAGRIIEQGSTDKIINHPLHPYTQGLIKSVPSKNKKGEKLHQIDGMVPSMFDLPKGCAFERRCYLRSEHCKQEQPLEVQHTDGRQLRCLNVGKET
jgi:peptide/nickel transport system ATP-binding protein